LVCCTSVRSPSRCMATAAGSAARLIQYRRRPERTLLAVMSSMCTSAKPALETQVRNCSAVGSGGMTHASYQARIRRSSTASAGVQHPVPGADGDGVGHDLVGPDQRVGVVACLLVPVAEVHAQVLAVDPEEPVVEPALPVVACDGLLMVVQLDLGNLFHGAPVRSSSPAGVSGDRSGGVILARSGPRGPMREAGPGGGRPRRG